MSLWSTAICVNIGFKLLTEAGAVHQRTFTSTRIAHAPSWVRSLCVYKYSASHALHIHALTLHTEMEL